MSQLSQLKQWTTIVADTGEIDEIRKHLPQDATTNPSLILAASRNPDYAHLLDDAVRWAESKPGTIEERLGWAVDKAIVNFGVEILNIIPGRVSTEVDAALSFDVKMTIDKAHRLIKMYEEAGIHKERILIKAASTWEGILAVRQLEKEGIRCNMTLMFSLPQAVMAAKAGATIISPFVGRILDWYKQAEGVAGYPAPEDPGVKSVQKIYAYYKTFGIKTNVMGASFRNKGEIVELAGCDLLTISPQFLAELESSNEPIVRKLDPKSCIDSSLKELDYSESHFRWALNEDQMATEKLSDGIRKFEADLRKLRNELKAKFKASV
jgi:transaldolase